jgi:hypothetical protein
MALALAGRELKNAMRTNLPKPKSSQAQKVLISGA